MKKKNLVWYILVFITWLAYVFLTFMAPVTESSVKYGLNQQSVDVIRITVALPILLIWMGAIFGALHLKRYADTIKMSVDGQSLLMTAMGLFVLVLGMIASSLLGTVRSINIYSSEIVTTITIVSNYLNVCVALLAYFLIFRGSKLLQGINNQRVGLSHKLLALIPLGILAVLYTWLTFTNPNRQIAVAADSGASFYLADPLIFLTITVPIILAWGFAFLSIMNIFSYMKNVEGSIYKQSLKYVALGLLSVISASVLSQALQAIGTARLLGVSLEWLLVIIYILLLIMVVGYVLIALGSKKLSKIEAE